MRGPKALPSVFQKFATRQHHLNSRARC